MAKHADDPGTLDLFPDELAAAFLLGSRAAFILEDDDDEPQPEVDVRLVPDSLVSSGSDEAARW